MRGIHAGNRRRMLVSRLDNFFELSGGCGALFIASKQDGRRLGGCNYTVEIRSPGCLCITVSSRHFSIVLLFALLIYYLLIDTKERNIYTLENNQSLSI